MKNLRFIVALLTVGVLLPFAESCKKGPEDPGISLKSRNKRLFGTWKMKSMENLVVTYTYSRSESNDVNDDVLTESASETYTYGYNGTNLSMSFSLSYAGDETHSEYNFATNSYGDSDNSEDYTETGSGSFAATYELSIYEDGTYSYTRKKEQNSASWAFDIELDGDQADPLDVLDADGDGTDASLIKDDLVTAGQWYWAGEEDGAEERVLLYAGPLSGYLVRLSSAEIKIEPAVGFMYPFISGMLGFDYSSLSFNYTPDYGALVGYSLNASDYDDSSVDRSRTEKDEVNLPTYSVAVPGQTDDGILTAVVTEKVTVTGGISTWEKTDKVSDRNK